MNLLLSTLVLFFGIQNNFQKNAFGSVSAPPENALNPHLTTIQTAWHFYESVSQIRGFLENNVNQSKILLEGQEELVNTLTRELASVKAAVSSSSSMTDPNRSVNNLRYAHLQKAIAEANQLAKSSKAALLGSIETLTKVDVYLKEAEQAAAEVRALALSQEAQAPLNPLRSPATSSISSRIKSQLMKAQEAHRQASEIVKALEHKR